ncbi:MAG TPA: glycoside hydrolase family 15 protein [Streptosporangiaceae bacterium]|jgi:GH15 family glucan-1,4-alpha-glucosidase|nr:glycoside hydrolase family 15 protein [Streptosporangiaceae bacterium]
MTSATAHNGFSPFPPIADYGFLSDGEVTALIAPSGSVEWLCLPRMDGPSIFGSVLDRDAGWFRFGPADVEVPADRRYLPGTMVLETTWSSGEGWLVIRDCLVMGPWRHQSPERGSHLRPPTDYDSDHLLLRTVTCTNGSVQLVIDCEPVFDYGRKRGRWEHTDLGFHQVSISPESSGLHGPALTLTSDIGLGVEGASARARTLLREGDTRFCALSWGHKPPPQTYEEADQRLMWTAHHWRHWLARGNLPDHRWRTYLARSALTLKGLAYAPTGAIAAAATTSLPEAPGGERNFDYRYSWIRDATFALWGLFTLGFEWEASDYFAFIADLVERDQDDLQIVYAIDGGRNLDEHTLDHLRGYQGARPVRVGNAAYSQRQHDVWGAVLDSLYLHTKSRDWMDERVWQMARHQVEQALTHWREPDRGIWEVRGDPQHFTSSKMFCWVAADRGARLARIRDEPAVAAQWQQAADEIHADICANAIDDRGVFCQHYGTTALDASLLLMPLLRFLPPTDERIKATVLAIADELTRDGLVLRYRSEQTDDGFTGTENTFTICSFWLVSALSEIGEHTRARDLCEKVLSYASPLLLYAEQIDPTSGRHLGNFPQAFTHLALINAVMHVIGHEQHAARMRLGSDSTIAPRQLPW